MALTELNIKTAKPKEKEYMLGDGRGLWLLVKPNGKKYWRLRYWADGKEKKVSLGVYPIITLKEAREHRDELLKGRFHGSDPAAALAEQKRKADMKFETVAREWWQRQIKGIRTDRYAAGIINRLERFLFGVMGQKDIRDITPKEILALLRDVEDQGKRETAHFILANCSSIFRYAIIAGIVDHDPAADLRGALKPVTVRHRAVLFDLNKIRQLVRAMREYSGHPVIKAALWFLAYTFCRSGEVCNAEWTEIDWSTAEWRIPAEKMKMRRIHIVPLARQTVELLRDMKKITGIRRYIFAGLKASNYNGMINPTVLLNAIRKMGFSSSEMTVHGFRSMASTRLNEMGWPPDVIERQLAHVERNQVRAAYNHAEYLPERRKMMQAWADWLDGLIG